MQCSGVNPLARLVMNWITFKSQLDLVLPRRPTGHTLVLESLPGLVTVILCLPCKLNFQGKHSRFCVIRLPDEKGEWRRSHGDICITYIYITLILSPWAPLHYFSISPESENPFHCLATCKLFMSVSSSIPSSLEKPTFPMAKVTHDEHLDVPGADRRRTSVQDVPAFAEHGPLVDHKIPQADAVQQEPDLLWSRIRHFLREPLSEFFGVFILIMFGDGVVAQVVLSNGTKGDYQSISWGWG